MTLKEFLNQPLMQKRKLCPICGEYQCHNLIWCYGDGGEFLYIPDTTIRWQININTEAISSHRHSLKWWYLIWTWQMKEKLKYIPALEEFKKELLS